MSQRCEYIILVIAVRCTFEIKVNKNCIRNRCLLLFLTLMAPDSIVISQSEFASLKKNEKHALEYLKCFKKESAVALL